MIENILTLLMLILLQAVLGFDNLLYISLESSKAPIEAQKKVRAWGIGLAIVLRIVLLFVILSVIQKFQNPIWSPHTSFFHAEFNVHSLIVLFGGAFILYTAVKEIFHMVYLEEHKDGKKTTQSVAKTVVLIMIMNVVFSFDSILAATALTDVKWVMATAIIIGGLLMIVLSDRIANFLAKNRLYEILGLFILFLVGVMLISEGGHLAQMDFIIGGKDHHITPMSKATFYFILAILVIIDVVQGRYQKKLIAEKERQLHSEEKHT